MINEIRKLKDYETYENILYEIKNYCKDELNRIKTEKYEKEIQKDLSKSKYTNKEFKSMFKSIKVIENSYEKIDWQVWSTKIIQIGPISFSKIFRGDKEGFGDYYWGLTTLGTDVIKVTYKIDCDELYDLSYSDKNGNDLLKLYKRLNFKTITQDVFLEYVEYVFSILNQETIDEI
jgi:hypothetical protein